MLVAPQKQLFPIKRYGNLRPLVEKFLKAEGMLSQKAGLGYVEPLDRAGSAGEISSMVAKLEQALASAGVSIPCGNVAGALYRTVLLNPNVTVRNAAFVFNGSGEGKTREYYVSFLPDRSSPASRWYSVKVEQKRYLMESLIKALIGESRILRGMDFQSVAATLNQPHLFADDAPYDPPNLLTPLERNPGCEPGDRPGNGWRPTLDYIPSMAPQRGYVLEANQEYFAEALKSYAARGNQEEPGNPQNLEVCAGWGNFRAMMPKALWPTFIHMDWNPTFIQHILEISKGANVRVGNIYEIPYEAERFWNVVGLTPFVSLWFLDHALAEVYRVLRPGGRFFAFQDILPNDPQMGEQLVKRGLHAYAGRAYSLEEIRDHSFLGNMAMEFSGEGEPDPDGSCGYRKEFNRLMVMQNPHEYLEAWLVNELKYAGFNVLYAGPETVFHVERRQLHHVDTDATGRIPDPDIVFRKLGDGRGPITGGLTLPGITDACIRQAIGPNRLLQESTIWSVIAEKPE